VRHSREVCDHSAVSRVYATLAACFGLGADGSRSVGGSLSPSRIRSTKCGWRRGQRAPPRARWCGLMWGWSTRTGLILGATRAPSHVTGSSFAMAAATLRAVSW